MPRKPLRPALLVLALCLAGTAVATPAMHDTPEWPALAETPAAADPVLELLRQRGLVDAAPLHDTPSDLVLAALNFLDVPYRLGGKSLESGFDCSGFTRHVVALSLGLTLPHRADQQARDHRLHDVPRQALQPGDLVFFNTLRRAFSHVGIYIGGGRFIHSPRSGSEVRVENMNVAYWSRRFDGARRAPVPGRSEAGNPGAE